MAEGEETATGCALAVGVLLLLVISLGGYFAYTGFAPQLLLQPTTKYLYQFREMGRDRVSVIPDLFSVGQTKHSVEETMRAAGLQRWQKRYGDKSNHQVYRLLAGHGLACGYELYVEADYDLQDSLTSATVHQGGACF